MKEILIGLLIFLAVTMLFLATVRIRRCSLPLFDAIAWGLLALLVPLLGPFLVLAFIPTHRQAKQSKPMETSGTNNTATHQD